MYNLPEIEVVHDEQAAFWTFGREAYMATFGSYDLDCSVGVGPTPLDAIRELLDAVDA